jgi:hypothetical protein
MNRIATVTRESGFIDLACGYEGHYGNNQGKIFTGKYSGKTYLGYPCQNGFTYRVAVWGWSSWGASGWSWSQAGSTSYACQSVSP